MIRHKHLLNRKCYGTSPCYQATFRRSDCKSVFLSINCLILAWSKLCWQGILLTYTFKEHFVWFSAAIACTIFLDNDRPGTNAFVQQRTLFHVMTERDATFRDSDLLWVKWKKTNYGFVPTHYVDERSIANYEMLLPSLHKHEMHMILFCLLLFRSKSDKVLSNICTTDSSKHIWKIFLYHYKFVRVSQICQVLPYLLSFLQNRKIMF